MRVSAFERPFDSPPHADESAACGGLAAVSVGGRRLEIVLLDRFGDVVGEIRDSLRGQRITEQEADAFFSTFFPETLVEEFDLRNLLPIPERHPAVHDLQLTSDGRVWARLDPEFILLDEDRREHSRWRFGREPLRLLSRPTTVRRSRKERLPGQAVLGASSECSMPAPPIAVPVPTVMTPKMRSLKRACAFARYPWMKGDSML